MGLSKWFKHEIQFPGRIVDLEAPPVPPASSTQPLRIHVQAGDRAFHWFCRWINSPNRVLRDVMKQTPIPGPEILDLFYFSWKYKVKMLAEQTTDEIRMEFNKSGWNPFGPNGRRRLATYAPRSNMAMLAADMFLLLPKQDYEDLIDSKGFPESMGLMIAKRVLAMGAPTMSGRSKELNGDHYKVTVNQGFWSA